MVPTLMLGFAGVSQPTGLHRRSPARRDPARDSGTRSDAVC